MSILVSRNNTDIDGTCRVPCGTQKRAGWHGALAKHDAAESTKTLLLNDVVRAVCSALPPSLHVSVRLQKGKELSS